MNHQDILEPCDNDSLGQLASRNPLTLQVLREYLTETGDHRKTTVDRAAEKADIEPETLGQTPIDELDTDLLLALILNAYDADHLAQLPRLHRLARKIEAVHRANPDVPKGITLAIKQLEHSLTDHIERENVYVLKRMEHDQPPSPDTPIAQMNEEHGHLKQQLGKLRRITRNYCAPDSACRSWRRFYRELRTLDFRLSEQIHLERDVLFPRFQF